jgi:hypothetical protein
MTESSAGLERKEKVMFISFLHRHLYTDTSVGEVEVVFLAMLRRDRRFLVEDHHVRTIGTASASPALDMPYQASLIYLTLPPKNSDSVRL